MFLLKSSLLLFLLTLFNCGWGASPVPGGDTQNNPKLKYEKLFPPSSRLSSSPEVKIFRIVDGAIKAYERPYYHWLLAPLQKLEIVPKAVGLPEVGYFNTLWILTREASRLNAVKYADKVALFAEVDTEIDKHANLQEPQEPEIFTEQYSEALKVWANKYGDMRRRYEHLRVFLGAGFSGEQLKISLYELTFFFNLISFETAFEVLRKHKEESGYTKVLVNTLGDSLLDGGQQLGQFYGQLETAIEAIGYSPKDLKMLEGVASSEVARALRDILGELIHTKTYDTEQREFVKRMWRAACTLHLTAYFHFISGQEGPWETEFAPTLYQAIDVGSTEVFDSTYSVYKDDKFIEGHDMLVEVQRTTGSSYRVRQFNSGDGIRNHKEWKGSATGSVQRYLSFVDMPNLSEDRIKQSGYYAVTGSDHEALISKLYKNKPLIQRPPTDPLLCEREQLAGTCTASSKMFYLRAFGLDGRMLEIDFKVELIKQLLDRIDRVHAKGSPSRTVLLQLVKAEERARLTKDTGEEAEIRKGREGILKVLKVGEADQFILLFLDMFVSLAASALNDILYSLYWIIGNDKPDMAKDLFEHFLKETEPIFKETSTYGSQLLDRVSPLIRDLHGKLLKDTGLPFKLGSKVAYKPPERLDVERDAISSKTQEIRKACLPVSEDKLPECFYHIIDAIYVFPYAPELAAVTSEMVEGLKVLSVPAELSYVFLDAMRTVYGKDFNKSGKIMNQVAFARNLTSDYRSFESPDVEECREYSYEDLMTGGTSGLARCIYARNGPVKCMSSEVCISKIKQIGSSLTLEELPSYFYYVIHALREYPDKALHKATKSTKFDFKKTPPALAYLVLDAMRSTHGEEILENLDKSKVAFAKHLPWSYKGRETLPAGCEMARDEDIVKDWEWLAACSYAKNGEIRSPTSSAPPIHWRDLIKMFQL